MKKLLSEEQEQRLTERFEQGSIAELSDLEKDAIRSYAQNQDWLRTVPVPNFDAAALSRQMRERMCRGWLFSTGFGSLRRNIFRPAPVFAGAAVDRLKGAPIDEIVVTDTIPLNSKAAQLGNVKILTVSALLGEAIKRIHRNESISSMFNGI